MIELTAKAVVGLFALVGFWAFVCWIIELGRLSDMMLKGRKSKHWARPD